VPGNQEDIAANADPPLRVVEVLDVPVIWNV
jgi:hypothetical protein